MKDKKNYNDLLKVLAQTASSQVVLNKLIALYVDTEDQQLKQHINKVATLFRSTAMSSKLAVCLTNQKPAQFPIHKDLPAAVRDALAYCQQCIQSIEPQWQILARQAGWAPVN